MPADVTKWLSIPWRERGRDSDGVDCWGFVLLYLWEEHGWRVPAYSGAYMTTADREDIARVVAGAAPSWEEVMEPQAGDVVLFRITGFPCHAGVMTGPADFLHAMEGVGVSLAQLRNPRWKPRVVGFYRWVPPICTH